ncbi:penicillin-binding protein 2 [Marinimicrobium sp. ABcell2]|uniref:penicillin-binding protein 2 n=1 Tax=Marinimicrobium sp. ABcell2 TaxID=3069751 RepID=UPI0027B05A80|nr:penicillin-binding protein 2 [Marinimicrobium sp. ABcell2]MDQ2076281.1 penicillin-binding protein 2 [Marinimicrobium sp. ABcell2]
MSESHRFKDHHREERIFFVRMVVAGVIMALAMALLIGRYYSLQVISHQDYATRSDRNRVHVQPVPPTRGLISDRNGELLAGNRPIYILSVIPERISNLDETLKRLKPLVRITPSDLEKFYDQLQQPRKPFAAVPLRYQLNETEIARLAVNEFQLEGVEVEAQLVRYYPQHELFAHSIGYVGRISQSDLARFAEDDLRRYSGTHSIGKNGLEAQYERELLGEVGNQNVETNARGRVLRVLGRVDPKPGKDLELHMDLNLQRTAAQAMEGRRGAVVALDVETGGVLAAVSLPSFNPNLFVTGISFADFRALNQSLDLPLYNRFLQGQYPPGSTLKSIIGLAGLHHDVVDTEHWVRDPGFYRLPNSSRLYRDWRRTGHGPRVDMMQAMVESCDVYYYDLGHRMGVDLMHSFGIRFGLGNLTKIDLPSERRGIWPSREWKRGARGAAWFPGDNLNMAIGQGYTLTTPLQLAVSTATLANRGKRMRPQVVRSVGGVERPPIVDEYVEIDDKHWDFMLKAMENVVHGQRGTARSMRVGAEYRMGGKTGTSQVVAIPQGEEYDSEALQERHRDHALFVGYAPADNPKIAVVVIVENGESGGGVAAPIARKLFDAYLNQQYAQPLPHEEPMAGFLGGRP